MWRYEKRGHSGHESGAAEGESSRSHHCSSVSQRKFWLVGYTPSVLEETGLYKEILSRESKEVEKKVFTTGVPMMAIANPAPKSVLT